MYVGFPVIVVAIAFGLWQGGVLQGVFGNGEEEAKPIATSTPGPKMSAPPAATPSAAPQPTATPEPTPAADENASIDMTFVGDVMMSDKVEGILKQNGYDHPYTYVKSYFEKADLSIANLETPITTGGTRVDKEYSYRSSPLALPPLAAAGIDLVNLANNHSMDRGPDGLMDTIGHLDKNGILHVGAGKNIDEAYKPAIVEKNGLKLAFFGFSRVLHAEDWKAAKNRIGMTQIYDPSDAIAAIKKAKDEVDLVVVLTHWGIEREDVAHEYQRGLARQFIDAGADLIVGSHPHVLQGFESYKGKWIAYSLGNFVFTTNAIEKTWNSAILQATCTKKGDCELNVVPVLTKFAQPMPMKSEQGNNLLKHLTQISFGAIVDSNGRITTRSP